MKLHTINIFIFNYRNEFETVILSQQYILVTTKIVAVYKVKVFAIQLCEIYFSDSDTLFQPVRGL